MQDYKNLIVPIVPVIALVIGNFYQGLTKEELDIIQDGVYAVGTLVAGGISSYFIYRKRKDKYKDK